jgi:hypothetical protein
MKADVNPPAMTAVTNVHQRHNWMCAVVAAKERTETQRLWAVRLALHLNITTGRCDPSYRTLAAEVGVSERTSMRTAAALEAAGWLRIERTAGGSSRNTNKFQLLVIPDAGETAADEAAPEQSRGDRAVSPVTGPRDDRAVSPVGVTKSGVGVTKQGG